jgi:hypothetical protein
MRPATNTSPRIRSWLLRTRRERPSEHRAAEKSDEFAPPHIPQA